MEEQSEDFNIYWSAGKNMGCKRNFLYECL